MNHRRILIPAVVCVCVGACAQNPVTPASQKGNTAPAGPSYEGGHMLGSGAFVDSTSTSTAATTDAAAEGDTTGRGGHMLGSGA